MKFSQTDLAGVYLVDLEPRGDERGFFSRVFCREEFQDQGVESSFVQVNSSFTKRCHTVRGLHYQLDDAAETKLIKCIRGRLWDVVLDLRPTSETYGQWTACELTAENRRMMFVPKGCAHGFMSLTDDVEMLYFVSARYEPGKERTVRWDDPEFSISWPAIPQVISDKDKSAPAFDPNWHLGGAM